MKQIFFDELLANHTTLRIGGSADLFFVARTTTQLVEAVRAARAAGVSVTMLGGGSNVLVSDKGIRGLVIKNETRKVKIGEPSPRHPSLPGYGHFPPKLGGNNEEKIIYRWQSDSKRGTFKYEFSDLNYDEGNCPRVGVVMDSGVSLQMAISDLLAQGVTGLQWYAKIPGTIGGAVYNNIHGGTHFISEVVKSVKVLDPDGAAKVLSGEELGLVYDKSRFHQSGEIILEVEFELFWGDVERAKSVAREWAKRKSLQPTRSAGCTFKNISNEDKERLDLPTTSAGYIIEHILKMGGYKVGGAMISTAHHNFIVNNGEATAADYLAVMREVQKRAHEKLGIELEPEIVLLGEF